MGRNGTPAAPSIKKTQKVCQEEVRKRIDTHRLHAKSIAVELLKKSLHTQLIDDTESDALIKEACLQLGVSSLSKSDFTSVDKDDTKVALSHKKVQTGRPHSRSSPQLDEHNEVCDVCEKGGDLLCCETCTLVFHLKCLRPKLPIIPKKKWSCPHCVLDNLAVGDKIVAKEGIQQMIKLAHGLDPEDPDIDPTFRLGKAGEITIVYSGKKYIVRKRAKRQIEELGRFCTLQEALITIPAVEEAKNGKKRHAKEHYDEDLWCTHCMDDSNIEICGFCGCKKCFGKFDAHLMVLCDNCERETHTFCMSPPAMEIPEADPWFCEACLEDREDEEPNNVKNTCNNDVAVTHISSEVQVDQIDKKSKKLRGTKHDKDCSNKTVDPKESCEFFGQSSEFSSIGAVTSTGADVEEKFEDFEAVASTNKDILEEIHKIDDPSVLPDKMQVSSVCTSIDKDHEVNETDVGANGPAFGNLASSTTDTMEVGPPAQNNLTNYVEEQVSIQSNILFGDILRSHADLAKRSDVEIDADASNYSDGVLQSQSVCSPCEEFINEPIQEAINDVAQVDRDVISPRIRSVPVTYVDENIIESPLNLRKLTPNFDKNIDDSHQKSCEELPFPDCHDGNGLSHEAGGVIGVKLLPTADMCDFKFNTISQGQSFHDDFIPSLHSNQHAMDGDNPDNPPLPPISSPTGSVITSPRGRGRPPGTFKRKDTSAPMTNMVAQNTYSIRPHRERSYQSLMSPLKKLKTDVGVVAAHGTSLHSKKPVNLNSHNNTSSSKKKKSIVPKRIVEAFDPTIYAVDNICKMIHEVNERKITPVDLDAIELLRIWSPKQDLEKVVTELTIVRDKLLRRLNRLAPEVAQDFLHKTNITDDIDFEGGDEFDGELDVGDPDNQNDLELEQDAMDEFISYGLEHDQHNDQMVIEGGESPDLLLQFSLLDESTEESKNIGMEYHSTLMHHVLESGIDANGENMNVPNKNHQTYYVGL